jgi:hypothetical protein
MEQPPFKLAASRDASFTGNRSDIQHSSVDANVKADRVSPVRRTRLAELDPHVHCSIIGTCLTTAELRKLIPRFAPLDGEHATDLEIHHTAVSLANEGGLVAKALDKALESRYAPTLKRFRLASDEAAVQRLWREALDSGDIPGAYWAVMTHPCATPALRGSAFGEVHMLSHLVGAANRADIRRLVALEDECAALRQKTGRQQTRLQAMSAERDAEHRAFDEQMTRLRADLARRPSPHAVKLADEVSRLRAALEERDQRLALHTARREQAERRSEEQQESEADLRATLERLKSAADVARAETRAVEEALARALQPDSPRGAWQSLQGKHIVYVGGRSGSSAVLERLVGGAGGALTVHDGGIEDRKGLLAAVLPRAHLVVFPVDCVSHDAMQTIKRLCSRHGIEYYPVRTASVASFVELLSRLAAMAESRQPNAPVSRFCIRHG